MNIVVSVDDNYVQHCAAMLVSLLDNNKLGISVFLLSEGMSEVNNQYLKDIVIQREGNYFYVNVDPEQLIDLPMPNLPELSHISIATYYRLLIPILLPASISKVIYLDCDIIVRKSIHDLWETNLDTYAIGAVSQISPSTIQDIKRLGFPFSFGYFNAGVILINLDYWRTHNISIALLDYIKSNIDNIKYHDQDALNAVLFDKCLHLSCKWNMLSYFFKRNVLNIEDIDAGVLVNNYLEYKINLKKEALDPTIIHFVSKPKPWHPYCTHPFRNEYYKYLKLTPWRNFQEPLIYRSFFYRLLRKIILILILKGETYFR